jgi:hypothetical protein
VGDLEGDLGYRPLTDARAVDEGLVREVHQVVDDQLVPALEVDQLAVAGPGGIVVLVQVGDQFGVGQGRVAGPHPDEAMALDHGVAAHARGRVDRLLRGHEHAAALRVVDQAVVAAGHVVALDLALGQRHQPVPAGVLERNRLTVLAAVQHELPAGDRPRHEVALELDVVRRGVPAVARPGGQLERAGHRADVVRGRAVGGGHLRSSLDEAPPACNIPGLHARKRSCGAG